jgi:L-fuconolactonase
VRIDSHQHFWEYHPSRQTWMNNEMGALKKDFLPADLHPLLVASKLDGCVAVQASQTEAETDFLLQLAGEYDFIKGIVGWVNLMAEDVEERLSYYREFKKIKGFRHVLHDEADIDFMLRPAFLNGISYLKKYGFSYDILIYPQHLPNTLKLVQQFPNQAFVVDHIAKPNIRERKLDQWQSDLQALANNENVYCKISGMVTEAKWKDWKKEDFTIYLDTVLELFGIKRLMYGSDWPVCTLSASYADMIAIVESYFSKFSANEKDCFFGHNARRFYNL